MKKLLMGLALFGAFAAVASDSVLYWMVNIDNDNGDNATIGTFSYARLFADTKTDGPQLIDGDWASIDVAGKKTDRIDTVLPSTYGDPKDWSFYVELYADSGWMKGKSSMLSWSELAANSVYTHTGGGGTGTTVFNTFTYNVPEPTSGLLLLLGVCGLALKRKRA